MPSPSSWNRAHMLALEGMSAPDLLEVMAAAEALRDAAAGRAPRRATLAERTVANLFFEDSTRTRSSFVLAARRLGADTLEVTSAGSSVNKGETLVDTALNLRAMGVDAFVVRTSASGGALMVANAVDVPVINAGDGRHEHPTQGLLDIMTLRHHLGDLAGRTVAIVGDIANSRVARSNIHGLTTLGAHVLLIGPPTLVPGAFAHIARADSPGAVRISHDLDAALPGLDAIMMLRIQFERAAVIAPATTGAGGAASHPRSGDVPPAGNAAVIGGDYRQFYGLSAARAARLPRHAVIMHPGPVNRGLEIDSEVADDPRRSVILQQVSNGVAVRMAVLDMLLSRRAS